MNMAELKTKLTDASVADFINTIPNETRRQDCLIVMHMMQESTQSEPKLWGSSIVGFGAYHYKYASGQEGDWPLVSFSPRKQDLTLYLMMGFDHYADLLAKLGKHKTSKACLHLKRLSDVDLVILKELITASVEHMRKAYPNA
jgi:hypothetical protein